MATAPQQPDSESFCIEFEQEADGRWLADIPSLPGVMAYGKTSEDAEVNATALALRVLANRTEEARKPPKCNSLFVSIWPSCKPNRVYKALLRIGWSPKTEKKGSHVKLQRLGWPDFLWAWHEGEELGPVALSRIVKKTDL